MQQAKQAESRTGKVALTLCNIVLLLAVIFFAVRYSAGVQAEQQQTALDTFCTTVETMKQLSTRYLDTEENYARDWAAYIESQNMDMEQALEYIRASNTQTDRSAHIVDMDTLEAWSIDQRADGNTISAYQRLREQGMDLFIENMHRMFEGQAAVLGRYLIHETQVNAVSVGTRVVLRQADGSTKPYLLLRVIPVESMKRSWIFPVEYAKAEIGLITSDGDYVIPSASMRSQNFVEFVRSYNFADDYNGADAIQARLQQTDKGLMTLKNSRGEDCYWYYSALEGYAGMDILGCIPCSALYSSSQNNWIIVVLICGTVLVLAVLDGTYILRINRRLRETAKLAEAASEAKTQFLSSMSHDIRTPLNAVLGMTELARSRVDDTAYVQECLDKISISGSHLLTLINDILEISKVESGKTAITPAPFAVEELVANLESITRSQAQARGLQFEVVQHPLMAPWLLGDKLRLSQVYLNLLNNAVKYTPVGGKVWLEVDERRTADGVELVCIVRDNGMGMTAEFQRTMYDSFTRASDSRIDKTQGTGLGLAIVKRMVDLMHGTIQCKSAAGEGTTFVVCIPLQAAEAAAQPARTDRDTPQSDLDGMRLLVAEDNDLNWEIIQTMLEDNGIRCTRAENGRECIRMLEEADPGTWELVLMDVQMPELNGREATRELRRSVRADLREIPIAAMTADAFAEDVQACMDAGMDAHLAKPVDLPKVLATLRTLRGTRHENHA